MPSIESTSTPFAEEGRRAEQRANRPRHVLVRLYYPSMIRCLTFSASVLSSLVVASAFAGTAAAEPSGEPAPDASCVYTLSAPQLVSVSGALMVTATLSPFPCSGAINPNLMTVCLKAQGDSTDGECGSEARPIAARVFIPYRPGTTYESTGRGCGSTYTAVKTTCSTQGPHTATL
jgi:hypothetical protein